ncbi:MAG: hypothetical protein WC541_03530 [Dehalococcoidia bacterium]
MMKSILAVNMKYVRSGRPGIFINILSVALAIILMSLGGAACGSNSQNQSVEIVSVTGPIPPITPGGPTVEITLKNISVEPITGLTATLVAGRSFDFNFDVSPSAPLLPGASISQKSILIGGGFSDDDLYPLTVKATQQSGATSVFTQQVQIKAPR